MFTDDNVRLIATAAQSAGIEPAALLAVVECETNGSPFECDGRTPTLLYERHVAWREALKVSNRIWAAFKAAGLAIPKWNRATQYKDQGTSAKRLSLIARARAIDEEVANTSASWGLGQSMGFGFRSLGFRSATDMVTYMTNGGLRAQIEVLIREIKAKRLIGAMNSHDWATFALHYNGSGYKANRYDTRMAAAWRKWSRQLSTVMSREAPPPEQRLSKNEIEAIQTRLYELGYKVVGRTDGLWGRNTTAAISSFQAHEGLPVNGHYDDATKEALDSAPEAVPMAARADATADDLRGSSRTVDAADSMSFAGKAKVIGGTFLAGGGAADKMGLLDQVQDVTDKAEHAKSLWETAHDLIVPFFHNPTVILIGLILIIFGIYVAKAAKDIIDARVDDHRTGAHNGGDI